MQRSLLRWLPVACLLIFWSLALDTALSKSPTVDENVHITRGHVLWQTGDMRLQRGHMPLAHWLIGALLSTEPTLGDVTQLPSWSESDRTAISRELLWQHTPPANIDRITLLARIPTILAGLLTGAILWRWTRANTWPGEPGNIWPQVVVMLLFTFSPNFQASFTLATTDALITTLYVAVIYVAWRYGRRPSPGHWWLTAVMLGLALATKMTALALLPATFVIFTIRAWRGRPWPRRRSWWALAWRWLALLPVAGLVLWLVYGFEFGYPTGFSFAVPVPTYVNGFLRVQSHIEGGHLAFLLGDLSAEGWPHYFAVAFGVKTPAVTLLLLITAVILLTWQRRWWHTLPIWLPAVALFGLASYSRLNIGFRHILPVLPFVWLLIAGTASWWGRSRYGRPLLLLLLAWYGLAGLRQRPDYLAYFNEFAGGSAQGHLYLGDSNLDWGQDLKALSNTLKQVEPDNIYLGYYGTSDPTYYGLPPAPVLTERQQPDFTLANPEPGLYAISVSFLQGIQVFDPDLFAWFRQQEPAARIGYSIQLYDVSRQSEGAWMAHCLDPGPLLDQGTASQYVGQTALRHVYFDCHSSWVVPAGNQPGWYVLPQQEKDFWLFGRLFPAHFHSVFRHEPGVLGPSFELVYWDGQVDLETWAASLPGQASVSGETIRLPYSFGGAAQLLGYMTAAGKWSTIWQVQSTAVEPTTLTVAGHLYTDAATPLVADGLGYTSAQWQAGDLFLQFHIFDPHPPANYMETGLYNYLTGERTGSFVQLTASE